jgi:hypothetical protein
MEGAAAIDGGMEAGVMTDSDGDRRPYGASYDTGADEYVDDVYEVFLPVVSKTQRLAHTVEIPALSDDGAVANLDCSSWYTCRNAPTGNALWRNEPRGQVEACRHLSRHDVGRIFKFFDTSSIPSNAIIESATLDVCAVSLRLVDAQSRSWAQQDQWLLNPDGMATSAWVPGQRSKERHLLFLLAGIPPGPYSLTASVYQPENLQQIHVLDPSGTAVATEYGVTPITVTPVTFQPSLQDLDIPHTLRYAFDGQLELRGYGLSSEQVQSGDVLGVTLFWRALWSGQIDLQAEFELKDPADKTWAYRYDLAGGYPYLQPGEIRRVPYGLPIDADVVVGQYRLGLNLIDYSGHPLLEEALAICQVTVEGRARVLAEPEVGLRQSAQLGEGMALVGYDLDQTQLGPGDWLRLALYWRAEARMDDDYTVFTHLLDMDNRIRGQRDSVPYGGTCPTTGCLDGEFIADEYDMAVDADAPAGKYQIGVGMCDPKTMVRLPVLADTGERWVEDRILLLSTITVERAEE